MLEREKIRDFGLNLDFGLNVFGFSCISICIFVSI